jgi:uncharacterized protein (TIGR02996 family)
MPNLPAILDTIRHQPDDERHWLALASWLWDNGRDDEATVVRVFWPTLRENLRDGVSLDETLRQVEENAGRLAKQAREAEDREL